jgi:hypothetical protein
VVGLGPEVVGLLMGLVFRLGGGLVGVVVVGGGDGGEVVAGAVVAGAVVAGDGLAARLGFGERVRTVVRDGDGESTGPATTRTAKGTRMAGVTCGGGEALLCSP